MTMTEPAPVDVQERVEHVDVLIVGAGISGIGAAYHLKEQLPGKNYVVLDALESHGGTWWTHRYPGVRSDSDLFTFGYRFKPWRGPSIATSEEILRYLHEVIRENGLDAHIRHQHRVTAARWSTEDRRWTVDVVRGDTGEELRFTTDFLWMCQGYYRHDQGYTPEWPGTEQFRGRIVHPQQWPADLDGARRRGRGCAQRDSRCSSDGVTGSTPHRHGPGAPVRRDAPVTRLTAPSRELVERREGDRPHRRPPSRTRLGERP